MGSKKPCRGDGYGEGTSCLGADCDDTDANISPKAIENCSDGVDNNCNGVVDSADEDCLYPPDIYVDDDGCLGTGTGTAGNPYCKIQDAIDAASGGNVILVHDGTYYENITFSNKSLVVRSHNGPESTIIDGDTNADGWGDGAVVEFNTSEGAESIVEALPLRRLPIALSAVTRPPAVCRLYLMTPNR